MPRSIPFREGYVSFRGFKVWFGVYGDREQEVRLPLLCLHGGPGGTHDYLEPISALAASGRRVIFYDQLGNGKSDHPRDPSLWTVDLFLDELTAMRHALSLDRLHLFGQSWGGALAMEYALRRPSGLESLTLADTLASTPQWVAEANRLRGELPVDVLKTLRAHEEAGTTDDPAYQEAMMVFYRRHVCRLERWPDCLNRTFDMAARDPEVYLTMWGPSEFHMTGTLRDWDIRDRLGDIRVPTLVVGGRHDEATPLITGTVHRGIAGSEWVIFEESSHMPHLEEPERFLQVLNGFIERVEANLIR